MSKDRVKGSGIRMKGFVIRITYACHMCPLDFSLSGVVRMIAMYSEQLTQTSYKMSSDSSVSDARVQQFVDSRVNMIKNHVFSGGWQLYSVPIFI